MQANKVPVLIQWNGQSPQEARSAGEEEEEEESRRHLTISHNHVVTFKDCMFAVRLSYRSLCHTIGSSNPFASLTLPLIF